MKKEVLTLILLFGLMILTALLPPKQIEQMQQDAEEQIEIKVLKVKQYNKTIDDIQLKVIAKVSKVIKSKSDLEINDIIIVKYTHILTEIQDEKSGMTICKSGVGSLKILEKGKSYKAFLKKNNSNVDELVYYSPSAYYGSFIEND